MYGSLALISSWQNETTQSCYNVSLAEPVCLLVFFFVGNRSATPAIDFKGNNQLLVLQQPEFVTLYALVRRRQHQFGRLTTPHVGASTTQFLKSRDHIFQIVCMRLHYKDETTLEDHLCCICTTNMYKNEDSSQLVLHAPAQSDQPLACADRKKYKSINR